MGFESPNCPIPKPALGQRIGGPAGQDLRRRSAALGMGQPQAGGSMQDLLVAIVLILLVVVLAALIATLLRRSVARSVIYEFERGILYSGGRFGRVLEPGAYWHLRYRTKVYRVDLRPRFTT